MTGVSLQGHTLLAGLAVAACVVAALVGRLAVSRLTAGGMAEVQAAMAGVVVRMMAAVPLLGAAVFAAPWLLDGAARSVRLTAAAWAAGCYAVFTVLEAIAAAGRLQRRA